MTIEIPTPPAIALELQRFVATEIMAPGAQLDVDTPLAELGVDSAALLSLLLFVEQRFKVMVPDAELTRTNLVSLNALAACVHRLALAGE